MLQYNADFFYAKVQEAQIAQQTRDEELKSKFEVIDRCADIVKMLLQKTIISIHVYLIRNARPRLAVYKTNLTVTLKDKILLRMRQIPITMIFVLCHWKSTCPIQPQMKLRKPILSWCSPNQKTEIVNGCLNTTSVLEVLSLQLINFGGKCFT